MAASSFLPSQNATNVASHSLMSLRALYDDTLSLAELRRREIRGQHPLDDWGASVVWRYAEYRQGMRIVFGGGNHNRVGAA